MCAFRYIETTEFDCHRGERTVLRAGVASAEVQRLSRRTFSPTERTWELPTNSMRFAFTVRYDATNTTF
jgi:hypothetical protein